MADKDYRILDMHLVKSMTHLIDAKGKLSDTNDAALRQVQSEQILHILGLIKEVRIHVMQSRERNANA